jgi:hypothetical protein
MAITGSPAVIVQEQDLSSYVSADSVTTGAVVGNFEWGPVNAITKITSEGNLVEYFGKPYDWNYKDWFTAKNFLQYSSSLAVVRVVDSEAKNASDAGVGFLLENDDQLEEKLTELSIKHDAIKILARYPGNLGNKLRVCMLDAKGMIYENYRLNEHGAKKTIENGIYVYKTSDGTTVSVNPALRYVTGLRPLSEDEVVVVVLMEMNDGTEEVKEYGIFSTVDGSTDATGYGNYVFKYFNNNSNWIYLTKNSIENYKTGLKIDEDKNVVLESKETSDLLTELIDKKGNIVLEGKVTSDGNKEPIKFVSFDVKLTEGSSVEGDLDYGDYTDGWDLFGNEETDEAEVQLLMQGGSNIEIGEYIIQLAETRKDCLACVSPMMDEVVHKKSADAVKSIIDGSASRYSNSSYAFMDGNYKYQYDNYNDVYRWMPLNGDIAGIMAQLDSDENPWMSPGGKQIKNCIKLAFHPNKAERDDLFAYNVNPVTNFRAEGNILWGDWTRIDNTAFNFVGVRRLFLYVERAIKEYARNVMWKQNDEITETIFVQTVEPFLNDIVGGRGIQEFKVYAGASVTSPDEMDKGIFRAKILIKPVRSIRYVVLVFTAVRSDMSIEEVVQ